MRCADLLAGELDLVLEKCRTAGLNVHVEYTAPPRGETAGRFRVVKCRRIADNSFVLTAAREVPGKQF